MAQLYVQRNAQPDTWVMAGAPTATTVFLSLAATITYSDGSPSDTLPANTLALLPDGTSVSFDRTADVYVPYVIQGDPTLRIIKESLLPTLTSRYAPLARCELHGIKPYQPEPYLAAGGLGGAAPVTTVALESSTAARAKTLWNGSSNATPPTNWQTSAYDDSAWGHAVLSQDTGSGLFTVGGGVEIWPEGLPLNTNEQALFRQHFTLGAGPFSDATLRLKADDDTLAVYLNGTALSVATVQDTLTLAGATVVAALLPGADNVLAVWADNHPYSTPNTQAGLAYELSVTTARTGAGGATEGDILYYHGGAWVDLAVGTSGQELTVVSGLPAWTNQPVDSDTVGTVTSVAFAGPTGTSVSGSPITSGGTISLSWASQGQNAILAGPTSGSGAPTFRALVAGDIPSLPASQITSGQLATARGGTGIDASGATDGQLLIGQSSDHALGLATLTAGAGVSITNAGHSVTIAATGSGGTVTSVALTVPSDLSVSGSPVTGAGTLAVSANNQSANTVKAGPTSGVAATPGYRALVNNDLPSPMTIAGESTASDFKATGLTGATAATRYVGGTTTGHPTTGTFAVGDHVVTQDAAVWVCTTAGTPGTWTQIAGGGGGSSTLAGDTDVSISSPAAGQLLEYNGSAWVNYTVPAVRAYNSGNQSISAATLTVVTYDSTRFDQGTGTAQHSTSSNTGRLTCRAAGVYQITAHVQWTASTSGVRRQTRLRLNGSTLIGVVEQPNTSSSPDHYQTVTTLYSLAVNDYVEVLVFQDTSGSLNINVEANGTNEFMWVRVG